MVGYFLLIFMNDEFNDRYDSSKDSMIWTVRNRMDKANFKKGDIVYIRKNDKGITRVYARAVVSEVNVGEKRLKLVEITIPFCSVYKGETLYESLKFNRGASYMKIDADIAKQLDSYF